VGDVDQVDPVEYARRRAGPRAISQLLEGHIARVLNARARYRVEDTGLLTPYVGAQSGLPAAVRADLTALHTRIRGVIELIARQIEESRSREIEDAVAQFRGLRDRERGLALVRADIEVRVSYEALRMTVEFYSEINDGVLLRVEHADSAQAELDMMIGNAVMMFELADFVIGYIQSFSLGGEAELAVMHRDTMQRSVRIQAEQEELERLAGRPEIQSVVHEYALHDVKLRTAALAEVRQEWDSYLDDMRQSQGQIDAVRTTVPTLEVIRENARIQLAVLELIAILRLLRQTSTAIQDTVRTLQGFRLAPLTPTRVRRLLGMRG